jgi:hypothetical protein
MGRYFCDNCYVFRCYSLYLPVEVVFCVFICEHGPNQSHQQVLNYSIPSAAWGQQQSHGDCSDNVLPVEYG